MRFDYNPTTRVIFGENTLNRITDLGKELKCRMALIVTDKGLVAAGHVERAVNLLKKGSIAASVFDGVEENPTTQHVNRGVEAAKDFRPDILIGLGGGSVLDCAKGINFLYTNGGKMEDYQGTGKATKPMLPSIGIPTTAGTGSEAQSYALIAREETRQKMACGDIKARFRVVILDPVLVKSAPKSVRAVTGMDAISHAIESFVCTKRTPVSQMFAKEAWRLLSTNYEKSLDELADDDVLGNMLLGAHFAGVAIENSMLGAAHACANPLTARYNITHGIAVGLMLPHVIKFNGEEINGDYAALLETDSSEQQSAAIKLITQISEFKKASKWPERLRDFTIKEEALPALAKEAAEQWTAKFNPRPVGEREFLELYRSVF